MSGLTLELKNFGWPDSVDFHTNTFDTGGYKKGRGDGGGTTYTPPGNGNPPGGGGSNPTTPQTPSMPQMPWGAGGGIPPIPNQPTQQQPQQVKTDDKKVTPKNDDKKGFKPGKLHHRDKPLTHESRDEKHGFKPGHKHDPHHSEKTDKHGYTPGHRHERDSAATHTPPNVVKSVKIDGKTIPVQDDRMAKLLTNLATKHGDHFMTFREAATEAGYKLPTAGHDLGALVADPKDLKVGDVIVAGTKVYPYTGDGTVLADGKLIPVSHVGDLVGQGSGLFTLSSPDGPAAPTGSPGVVSTQDTTPAAPAAPVDTPPSTSTVNQQSAGTVDQQQAPQGPLSAHGVPTGD